MGEKLFNEADLGGEERENEPKGREIDVYIFRHGQATGEAPEAELTELGIQQAREAAGALLQRIEERRGVIKFLSSRTRRAAQTAEIMQEQIEKVLSERKIKNVKLLPLRQRTAITAAGVIGPLKKQGIEDPVEYWLTHPDVLEGKSPQEVSDKIQRMLRVIKRVADHLPPGEKVNYVAVTHEVPQAALINYATGKTLNELGGNIKNCESFQVQIEGKSDKDPTINFRSIQIPLKLS